ncbi:neuronal acetylcholine receptor subunit alpha-7-like [Ptychodera flava]|uniref:neuronal acetylcholine receptor subunit alpha-7-like n=1 Tax=Ptychodera flava TaxID=63121 RepID=UPI00396A08A6
MRNNLIYDRVYFVHKLKMNSLHDIVLYFHNKEWRDEFLSWNASDYDGIETIRLPVSLIWTPDIKLYNLATEDKSTLVPTNAIINSNGRINWNSPAIYVCRCIIQIKNYPFDRQKCEMVFGSWVYDVSEIDLHKKGDNVDTSIYLENEEWSLNEVALTTEMKHYNCCDIPYGLLIMTLDISRKPLHVIFCLVVPNFLFVSITICSFYMPPQSRERTTLVMANFLALLFLQQVVVNTIPRKGDHWPTFSKFFAASFICVGLSCCLTMWILRMHHHSTNIKAVPDWLFNLTQCYIAPIICMGRNDKRCSAQPDLFEWNLSISSDERSTGKLDMITEIKGTYVLHGKDDDISEDTMSNEGREQQNVPEKPADEKLNKIVEELEYLRSRVENQQRREEIVHDWKLVLAVIDRTFMIFLIGCFLSTLSLSLC